MMKYPLYFFFTFFHLWLWWKLGILSAQIIFESASNIPQTLDACFVFFLLFIDFSYLSTFALFTLYSQDKKIIYVIWQKTGIYVHQINILNIRLFAFVFSYSFFPLTLW